jgi:hypothetical protein
MDARNRNTTPPRTGLRRFIVPWEYRHLRASGVTRLAGGGVLTVGGVLLLYYRAYGWAALFLVLGTLNLGGGYRYITIARSAPRQSC